MVKSKLIRDISTSPFRSTVVIVCVAFLEYFILHPGYTSVFTFNFPIEYHYFFGLNNSIYALNGTLSPYTYITLLFEYYKIPEGYYLFSFNMIQNILAFCSMAFSLRYFIMKYGSLPKESLMPTIIGIAFAIPYMLNPASVGGFAYPYMFSLPLLFVGLDFVFSAPLPQKKHELIKKGILLSIVVSFNIFDPRTFVYAQFIVLFYILYKVIITHALKSTSKYLQLYLSYISFFILLNVRTLLGYFTLGGVPSQIFSYTASSQLFLAYQNFPFIDSLSGVANWYQFYLPFNGSLWFSVIPSFVIRCAFVNKKMRKIMMPPFLIILIITVSISFNLVSKIDYMLGQTRFFSYAIFLYPTFLISILYYPLVYLLFGMGTFFIIECFLTYRVKKMEYNKHYTINNGKNHDIPNSFKKGFFNVNNSLIHTINRIKRPTLVVLIVLIVLSQVYLFASEAHTISEISNIPQIPSFVSKSIAAVDQKRPTGITYLDFSPNLPYGEDMSLIPNSIDLPQYSYLSSFIDYTLLNNYGNLSILLSYFGVQFIVFLHNNSYSLTNTLTLSHLMNTSGFKLIYSNRPAYVFENSYYRNMVSSNSLYEIFNTPISYIPLSTMNETFSTVPAYTVSNQSHLNDLLTGIVGYNLSTTDLESLFFDKSWLLNIGDLTVNQFPSGWQTTPIYWTGDAIHSLTANGIANLSVRTNFSGKFSVFVLGGVAQIHNYYGSGKTQLDISSNSGQHISAQFNQLTYSPMIQWTYAGNLSIKNVVHLSWDGVGGHPFVSRLALVPINMMANLVNDSRTFVSNHNLIDFTTKSNVNLFGSTITTHPLPGERANFIVKIPNVAFKYGYKLSTSVGGANMSYTNHSYAGTSPMISNNLSYNSGYQVFSGYYAAIRNNMVINNSLQFGSYSQSSSETSVASVVTNQTFTLNGLPSVYEPAEKEGSVSLHTRFNLTTPFMLSIYAMSTKWGENPGFYLRSKGSNYSLLEFNGAFEKNGITSGAKLALNTDWWYKFIFAVNNTGTVNETVYSVKNSYTIGSFTVGNIGPVMNCSLDIRSDNGDIWWNLLEIMNTSKNGDLPLITNLNSFLNSGTNFPLTHRYINAFVSLSLKLNRLNENASNVRFYLLSSGKETAIYSYYVGLSNSKIPNALFAAEKFSFKTHPNFTFISTYEGYSFVQATFIQSINVINSNLEFHYNYGMTGLYVINGTKFSVTTTLPSMSDYEYVNTFTIAIVVLTYIVIRRKLFEVGK